MNYREHIKEILLRNFDETNLDYEKAIDELVILVANKIPKKTYYDNISYKLTENDY